MYFSIKERIFRFVLGLIGIVSVGEEDRWKMCLENLF